MTLTLGQYALGIEWTSMTNAIIHPSVSRFNAEVDTFLDHHH